MKKTLFIISLISAGILSSLLPAYSQTFAKQGSFISDGDNVPILGQATGWIVKADASGNIYLAGTYQDPARVGFFQFANNLFPVALGEKNICVFKLSPTGNLTWGKIIRGVKTTNKLQPSDLSIDSGGNVYLTGLFAGTVDFDPGVNISNLTSLLAGRDPFLLKLASNGDFAWVKQFKRSGTTGESGFGPSVTISPNQTIIVAGAFKGSIDLDPSILGSTIKNSVGNNDIFIVKLSAGVGNYSASKSIGGINTMDPSDLGDTCERVIVDPNGSVLLTGNYTSTADFDPGAGVYNLVGGGGYILKLDDHLNFVWAKRFATAACYDLALDMNNNIYMTGSFGSGGDFDPGPGTFNLTQPQNIDTFVVSLTSLGDFRWAKAFVNNANNGLVFPSSLAVNTSGVYLTGGFSTTADFNPDQLIYNLISAGEEDIFIEKLSLDLGAMQWTRRIGNLSSETSLSTALDPSGNLISTGYFNGQVDFNPGAGNLNIFYLDSSLPQLHQQLYITKFNLNGLF